MEQQFKNRILSYLVGDYQTQSPINVIDFEETDYLTSNIATQLANLSHANVRGRTTDYDNKYIIVYGAYGSNQYYTGKGFILMADYNLQTIELFTQYAGGTDIPSIEYLTTAEDGTFYGITADANGVRKMTMFNNFTLTLTGTYKLEYRQSYALDSSLSNASEIKVSKKIGTADYVFIGPTATGPSSITQVTVATVQIVVGGENEWTHTNYSVNIDYYQSGAIDGTHGFTTFASWVDDNYYIKICGESGGHYVEYKATNGGAASSYTSTFSTNNMSILARGGVVIPSYSTSYVATMSSDNTKFLIYKVEPGIESLIYTRTPESAGGYSKYFIININNNNVFFCNYCTYEVGNAVVGMVDNGNAFEVGQVNDISEYSLIISTNQFNIMNVYVGDLLSNAYKGVLIYNKLNYNGKDYQALNSMIPHSGILYDENNKIIFARNLYNRIINANTTESIIEVPNNYLNDTIIDTKELISETNSILNTNTQSIEKNIYESVYINFFNTLNMSNQNDPNDIIINTTGATRLNQSISGLNSYNNVKLGIIKINYSDSTSENLGGYILTKQSNTLYTISFNIYVLKAITSIQFLSADGTTTYLEISPTLEIGKTYSISQDVKIV